MILRIGNDAFRPLSDVLELPGTKHLGAVDIGVAQPVIDLRRIIENARVDWWLLTHQETFAAADAVTISVRPQVAADWQSRARWDQQSTEAIPERHDVLIIEVGARTSPVAIVNDLKIVRVGGAAGSLTIGTRQLMWWGDSQDGVDVIHSNGSPIQTPFPWFVRDFNPNRQETTLNATIDTSAAGEVLITMSCISADPGVLDRFLR